MGGGAHLRVADAFSPAGTRLREPGAHTRGLRQVGNDRHDAQPARTATGTRTLGVGKPAKVLKVFNLRRVLIARLMASVAIRRFSIGRTAPSASSARLP